MCILEVYLLFLVVIGLWYLGLVPAIRYVFKNFITFLLHKARKSAASSEEKERLIFIHRKAVKIIDNTHYREFIALLPIALEFAKLQADDNKDISLSETTQTYIESIFIAIVTCLYACTLKGFLSAFWVILRYIMAKFFTVKISKIIAQPTELLRFLGASFSTPLVTMYQSNYKMIWSLFSGKVVTSSQTNCF